MNNKIHTCFSPSWYPLFKDNGKTVVVIDIMRATTSICAALAAGAKAILPVGSVEEARKAKDSGYILAAERDGIILDFADFGNSPDAFTPERVEGKTIAYSTTNGTQAIKMASEGDKEVLIGAFVNVSVVVDYLKNKNEDVLLFCAGWKNRFSLEDSLCAGMIADRLIKSGGFETVCDSTIASIDLWSLAEKDLFAYIDKCSHRHRLRGIVSDDIIRYCHTPDLLKILPVLQDGLLIRK